MAFNVQISASTCAAGTRSEGGAIAEWRFDDGTTLYVVVPGKFVQEVAGVGAALRIESRTEPITDGSGMVIDERQLGSRLTLNGPTKPPGPSGEVSRALQLALAVLRGDTLAGLLLADLVQEEHGLGEGDLAALVRREREAEREACAVAASEAEEVYDAMNRIRARGA